MTILKIYLLLFSFLCRENSSQVEGSEEDTLHKNFYNVRKRIHGEECGSN